MVQFANFEVKASDTAKTYANSTPTSKTDANITVKGCASNDTIIIRSSGFANFATVNVPNGNGTLTAVYAYYKSPYNGKITPQIYIRDTSDVQFTGSRCDGTTPPPTPPSNATMKSIKDIRAMYVPGGSKLGSYQIGGVVISDAANKNVSPGLVVLQDGDHGISVYFGGTISYNVGDSIVLDVTGDSLLSYRGSMEIKTAYGSTKPTPVATGKTVVPVEMSISAFNNALSDIEFTLVKIKSATASGGSTYAGNRTLTDATGNTVLYTSSSATFASNTLPADAKDWVGYGTFYNTTKELIIRNTGDVSDATAAGGGGSEDTVVVTPPPAGGSDLLISEYVEGSSNNKYIEIYNAGSSAADLSQYTVKLYANGKTEAEGVTNEANLIPCLSVRTLAPGGIIVLMNSSAALSLPAGVTAHISSVCNFNGDDALTLVKSGTVIDVFGTVGTDPGTSWTIAGDANAAVDHSVRRKTSVTAGKPRLDFFLCFRMDLGTKDDVSNLGNEIKLIINILKALLQPVARLFVVEND